MTRSDMKYLFKKEVLEVAPELMSLGRVSTGYGGSGRVTLRIDVSRDSPAGAEVIEWIERVAGIRIWRLLVRFEVDPTMKRKPKGKVKVDVRYPLGEIEVDQPYPNICVTGSCPDASRRFTFNSLEELPGLVKHMLRRAGEVVAYIVRAYREFESGVSKHGYKVKSSWSSMPEWVFEAEKKLGEVSVILKVTLDIASDKKGFEYSVDAPSKIKVPNVVLEMLKQKISQLAGGGSVDVKVDKYMGGWHVIVRVHSIYPERFDGDVVAGVAKEAERVAALVEEFIRDLQSSVEEQRGETAARLKVLVVPSSVKPVIVTDEETRRLLLHTTTRNRKVKPGEYTDPRDVVEVLLNLATRGHPKRADYNPEILYKMVAAILLSEVPMKDKYEQLVRFLRSAVKKR